MILKLKMNIIQLCAHVRAHVHKFFYLFYLSNQKLRTFAHVRARAKCARTEYVVRAQTIVVHAQSIYVRAQTSILVVLSIYNYVLL